MATQTLSAEALQDHGHQRRGHPAPRRFRQGHHPGRHRQDRHRRRPGLRAGVPRLRDPGAVHGSPDDHLQHVHRSRRPRRTRRPGPDHLRLHVRPPARAAGRRVGCRRRVLEHPALRGRRDVRRRGGPRRRHPGTVRDLGDQPRPGRVPVRQGALARGLRRRERQGRGGTRAAVHGPGSRHADEGHPGGHGLPGLLHQLPDGGPPRRRGHHPRPRPRTPTSGCWWCPAPPASASKPRPRAWTRSSRTSVPNGASPAAPCAWA